MLEPNRRARLNTLYKRKPAEYKTLIQTKHASFRKLIFEGLVTNKPGYENVSTADMFHNVLEYIAKSKRHGDFTCLLTLDIKRVLDSLWRTDILCLLDKYCVDPDLLGVIDDFMLFRSECQGVVSRSHPQAGSCK